VIARDVRLVETENNIMHAEGAGHPDKLTVHGTMIMYDSFSL